MASKMSELGIDGMSPDDRLKLVQEIWDSLAEEPVRSHLTDAKRLELERRIAEHDANPGDVIPWEQIKADALARFAN